MSKHNQPYYADYLLLDELLRCQQLRSECSGSRAHDEMLFIIVHQAYELWFKQILHESTIVIRAFSDERVSGQALASAVVALQRIVVVQKVLITQVEVLETMTPLDFLEFRDLLIPASGFQSKQFRLIENRLGMRPQDRISMLGSSYKARFRDSERRELDASELEPSLFVLVERWLERTPFLADEEGYDFLKAYREATEAVIIGERPTRENLEESQAKAWEAVSLAFKSLFDDRAYSELVATGQRRMSRKAFVAALFINLYRDEPTLQYPFRLLSLLLECDELLFLWRYHHAAMVARMIGHRIGTGGTSGMEYLYESTHRSRIYSDLLNLTVVLVPRSKIPPLPARVRRRMSFYFDSE